MALMTQDVVGDNTKFHERSNAAMLPTIAIAADHAGFALKAKILADLRGKGYAVTDLGTHSEDRVDYPDYGFKLAETIAAGQARFGIGICGSGIGISIALNRNAAIRAALCHDVNTATLARQHNDANVLALGGRILSEDTALACVDAFLKTEFEGGRHATRVEKLKSLQGCRKENDTCI
jgi:ribose 5-phosphate isomerase B